MDDEEKSRVELIAERDRALEALRRFQAEWRLGVGGNEQEVSRLEASNLGLSLANLRLQQTELIKSRFYANMNHELRTPLNSVIGFLEDAIGGLAGPLNAEQTRYLQHALGSAEHLLSVLNELLDITLLENGEIALKRDPVQLAPLVEATRVMLGPSIERKGQTLVVAAAPNVPPALGDGGKLLQVLLNLVSNANKYTSAGGRIEIFTAARVDWVRVEVRDNGIGIAPHDLPRLFEEFTPLAKNEFLERHGTGLGLAITKRLVELHGGSIDVASEPGRGSVFGFTLPAAPPD